MSEKGNAIGWKGRGRLLVTEGETETEIEIVREKENLVGVREVETETVKRREGLVGKYHP